MLQIWRVPRTCGPYAAMYFAIYRKTWQGIGRSRRSDPQSTARIERAHSGCFRSGEFRELADLTQQCTSRFTGKPGKVLGEAAAQIHKVPRVLRGHIADASDLESSANLRTLRSNVLRDLPENLARYWAKPPLRSTKYRAY